MAPALQQVATVFSFWPIIHSYIWQQTIFSWFFRVGIPVKFVVIRHHGHRYSDRTCGLFYRIEWLLRILLHLPCNNGFPLVASPV